MEGKKTTRCARNGSIWSSPSPLVPDKEGESSQLLLGLERLHGLLVGLPLVLNGFLQEHILHLYGVSGLASANLPQTVPFIKAFSLSASHPSPRLTTYSHRRSGKNTVEPGRFRPFTTGSAHGMIPLALLQNGG